MDSMVVSKSISGQMEGKVQKAWEKVKSAKETQRERFDVDLAESLSYLKEQSRFRLITRDRNSLWSDFLAREDIKITYEKAQRLMLIYDVYIKELKADKDVIVQIDQRSLLMLVPFVTPANVKSWLKKARILTRFELHKELVRGAFNCPNCKTCTFENRECDNCAYCGTD